jgi:hypothetical protein
MSGSVVVYGGEHYNNVQQVYEIFYSLTAEQDYDNLWTTEAEGAPSLLSSIARSRGVGCNILPAAWLMDGSQARRNQRSKLLDRAQPEMVVLFPGGEVDEMRELCDARDIPVWDLTGLPYADLGSGLQLGDDDEVAAPF